MLTRTPAQHHDYNLKLTKEELFLLSRSGDGDVAEITRLYNDLFALIDREAKKINGGS